MPPSGPMVKRGNHQRSVCEEMHRRGRGIEWYERISPISTKIDTEKLALVEDLHDPVDMVLRLAQ